jgi:hypothetical protein
MGGIRSFPHRRGLGPGPFMAAGAVLMIIGLLMGYSYVAANSISDSVRTAMAGSISSRAACCISPGRPFN